MKVVLSNLIDHPINRIYTSARTCYSNENPDIIFKESLNKTDEEMLKLIRHVLDSRHESVLEHISFTFYISDVSRCMAMQLIRHRLNNFSMMSQRYCKLNKEDRFNYVTPNTVSKSENIGNIYSSFMEFAKDTYNKLIEAGVPAEDARYVLPEATCSNITMSVNLRQLIHIAGERRCNMAQWEIRNLVNEMCKQVVDKLPFLKPYLVPKCEMLGYCPESKKRSCGRKPVKSEALNVK